MAKQTLTKAQRAAVELDIETVLKKIRTQNGKRPGLTSYQIYKRLDQGNQQVLSQLYGGMGAGQGSYTVASYIGKLAERMKGVNTALWDTQGMPNLKVAGTRGPGSFICAIFSMPKNGGTP